jgi:hypothetical protein
MQELLILHPHGEKPLQNPSEARNGITGFRFSRPGHGTRPRMSLKKDYIPGTADENHIFENQQKFMFTVPQ